MFKEKVTFNVEFGLGNGHPLIHGSMRMLPVAKQKQNKINSSKMSNILVTTGSGEYESLSCLKMSFLDTDDSFDTLNSFCNGIISVRSNKHLIT